MAKTGKFNLEAYRTAEFRKDRKEFRAAVQNAVKCVPPLGHEFEHPRFGWAARVFARACQHGQSVEILLHAYLDRWRPWGVDELAVANLCRLIFEECVLVSYMAEREVSEEEWSLRKSVLYLHAFDNKLELLKGIGLEFEATDERRAVEEQRDRLRQEPGFQKLSMDDQQDLLTGRQTYVGGFKTALSKMGVEEEMLGALDANLSQAIYSIPATPTRNGPTPQQRNQLKFSMGVARAALKEVTGLMRATGSSGAA